MSLTTQWNVYQYMFGMSQKTCGLKLYLKNNENNVPVFCKNVVSHTIYDFMTNKTYVNDSPMHQI